MVNKMHRANVDVELLNIFQKHIEKIVKAFEEVKKELNKDDLKIFLEEATETWLSEDSRIHVNPEDYIGRIFAIKVSAKDGTAEFTFLGENSPAQGPDIWINFEGNETLAFKGSETILLREFTEEYIKKCIRYLASNFKRSLSPSKNIVKDRKDVKKKQKIIAWVGAILSIFLMFKISFICGTILLIAILIFTFVFFPQMDIL